MRLDQMMGDPSARAELVFTTRIQALRAAMKLKGELRVSTSVLQAAAEFEQWLLRGPR